MKVLNKSKEIIEHAEKQTCPICKGNGVVFREGRSCSMCAGKGKIWMSKSGWCRKLGKPIIESYLY